MEKRLILAFILSILVLYLFNLLFYPIYPEKEEERKKLVLPKKEKKKKFYSPLCRIEPNPSIKIEFDKDGNISSWYIKEFNEEILCSLPPLSLEDYKKYPHLEEMRLRAKGLMLDSSKFNLKLTSYNLIDKNGISFTYLSQKKNLEVNKRLLFDATQLPYVASLTIRFINKGEEDQNIEDVSLRWALPGGKRFSSYIPYYHETRQLFYKHKKKEEVKYKAPGILTYIGLVPYFPKEEKKEIDAVDWVAYKKRHFVLLLIPKEKKYKAVFTKKDEQGIESIGVNLTPFKLKGEEKKFEFLVYAGPSYYHILKDLEEGTRELVGLNILSVLILYILKLFHYLFGNWGIAIIFLALFIKILLYPLTKMSLKATKELQQIQPYINKLKETYKNDKAKLQEEIIALYKRYRINPAAGCLPLLLQFPVFIALYSTLVSAAELRCAEFLLWIKDLSCPDPFFLLPILMGVTSLLSQRKMIPDPQQKRLSYILIGLFTFIFMTLPAGLNLYWLAQNILSLGEMHLLYKKKKAKF